MIRFIHLQGFRSSVGWQNRKSSARLRVLKRESIFFFCFILLTSIKIRKSYYDVVFYLADDLL